MLPDLRHLRLRHGMGAPTGADDENAPPDPKKQRPSVSPPRATAGASSSSGPPVLPEDDSTKSDKSLAALLKNRFEHDQTREMAKDIEKLFPLGKVIDLHPRNYDAIFDDALRCCEPPDRFFFSAGGTPSTFVKGMRLNGDSQLKLGRGAGTMPAFAALLALRQRFASKPSNFGHEQGCGSHNCYEDNVDVYGDADWQVALRGVLLTLDSVYRWKSGSALPKTVAIRSPKLAKAEDYFDWSYTTMHRQELQLTLLAALKGIGPPIYATFPVKVLDETNRTNVAERGYGYVTEAGWTGLHKLMHNLHRVHSDADELAEAKRNIATSITALMHKVASETEILLLDIKCANMVGRRVGATTQYETLMIDFDPTLAVQANRHADEHSGFNTSKECVFFINGLLFLNQVITFYSFAIPMFRDLCAEVVSTWRNMKHEEGNLCSLLQKDRFRMRIDDLPDMRNLMYVKPEDFFKHVRFEFYRMLEEYGSMQLLQRAEGPRLSDPNFLDRFVPLLAARFNQ